MPGGTIKYDCALDGTLIPDPERKVVVIGTSYEHLFGIGGGWDYITEENAEASISLLPELLRRLVTLRNEVKRLVSLV